MQKPAKDAEMTSAGRTGVGSPRKDNAEARDARQSRVSFEGSSDSKQQSLVSLQISKLYIDIF